MTAVLVAGALIASGFLGAQTEPSNLQCEQATNPPAVTDHRPDFRAVNNLGVTVNRFQIQVTSALDPTFATPLWSSAGPLNGTAFPGAATVANLVMSPEIPYGQGTANLLTLPLLTWGGNYQWRTRFGVNGGTWSNFSTPAPFTMAAPSWRIDQQQNNGDPSAFSWRFVGAPIAFGTSVPASQLLAGAATLYRLDEPTRTWVQLKPTDPIQGGQGYLAWAAPTATLSLNQGSATAGIPPVLDNTGATTTPSYNLTNNFTFTTLGAPAGQEITDGAGTNGYRGNALFANPFYNRISWRSSTQVTNGIAFGDMARSNISFAMYKWDGTQYLTYNGVTDVGTAGEWIYPFQAVGIWVQATPYQLWVNTPAPLTGGPQKAVPLTAAAPAPPTPNPDSWHLMMEARSGAALDTENAFGIDPAASDDWDVRDSEEPGPGTPTWVNVYFDHSSDFTTYPRKYTHDFRKTPVHAGDQVSWTFTVDGNTNLPATLTFPNLSDINPGDWTFTLEDPAQSASVVLTPSTSYDTLPVNGPSTLTLKATRLTDSPSNAPAPTSKSGGSSCGLLGPEGLLLAAWILARRACRMRLPS